MLIVQHLCTSQCNNIHRVALDIDFCFSKFHVYANIRKTCPYTVILFTVNYCLFANGDVSIRFNGKDDNVVLEFYRLALDQIFLFYTIVGILTFMSWKKFSLSCIEHEKSHMDLVHKRFQPTSCLSSESVTQTVKQNMAFIKL